MPNKLEQKKRYIRCKKCKDEVFTNTRRRLIDCKCGAISVDGCDEYVRVNGDPSDYEQISK